MKVLLTNDDGYQSPLYLLLADLLKQEAWVSELHLVAPAYEQSWIGSAISTHHPVKAEEITYRDHKIYSISGTPGDCVSIGAFNLLNSPPDLVISGINFGSNAGSAFATSSGTLAAARQAAYLGLAGIACSAMLHPETRQAWKNKDFEYLESNLEYLKKIAKLHLSHLKKCIFKESLNKYLAVSDYFSINSPPEFSDEILYVSRVKDTRFKPFFEKHEDGTFRHGFKGFCDKPRLDKQKLQSVLPFDLDLLTENKSSLTLFRLNTGDVEVPEDYFKIID